MVYIEKPWKDIRASVEIVFLETESGVRKYGYKEPYFWEFAPMGCFTDERIKLKENDLVWSAGVRKEKEG